MAKISLKEDYIVYIAVKAASAICCAMPLKMALFMGKIVGLSMYHFHPKRKRIAYANLKAAFWSQKSPGELKSILRSTYKNYGQSIIEMMRIPLVDYEYLKNNIQVEGLSRISEAKNRNKGVIFLTSHFGNWELSGLKSSQIGFPLYSLTQPQKYQKLNVLLNEYREKLGSKIIKRGMSFREIIRALKRNDLIAILTDQDVGKDGVFLDFLGRPASHAIGAARLARDTQAAILPCFTIREKGHKHRIVLEELITVPKSGDRDLAIKKALEEHARLLEAYVTKYPDQWMWVYTRWKSTPVRKVVVLNDGIMGHLNQSLAVLNIIKKCRRAAGFSDDQTHVKIVNVVYKNRPARTALGIFSLFASHSCQGRMKCLKLTLKEDSYQELMRSYADIVISCGSSLAPVNIFLSKENNSKNVVIMKPGIFEPLRKFDIAIIPEHDRPKPNDNLVVTDGSPSLIDRENMADGGRRVGGFLGPRKNKRLGVLIGGNTPKHSITKEFASKLLDNIEAVLNEFDMELLVTTSRRTPKDVEEVFKTRLRNNPRCGLLVIANEKNIENAVGGILELSDIVLVSGESMSMVSEAASSGKKTIVFDLLKKKGRLKHDYAIKNLEDKNYIAYSGIEDLSYSIRQLVDGKKRLNRLNDNDKMYEKLYRII